MFCATNDERNISLNDNTVLIDNYLEVETQDGWKYADEVKAGDIINDKLVINVSVNETKVNIQFE